MIRIKMNTTTIYFKKKVLRKVNLILNTLKWMFVYHKCYILYYDRIDVSEGLMLIKQVYQKGVTFVTIGISWIKILSFNQMSTIDVYEP